MNLLRCQGAEVHTANARLFGRQRAGRRRATTSSASISRTAAIVETLLGTAVVRAGQPAAVRRHRLVHPAVRNIKSYRDRRQVDLRQADDAGAGELQDRRRRSPAPAARSSSITRPITRWRRSASAQSDVKMSAAERAFEAGGHKFAPGAFVIPNANRAALEPQISELGLLAWATNTPPSRADARPRRAANRLHPLLDQTRRTKAGCGWRSTSSRCRTPTSATTWCARATCARSTT